MPKSVQLNKEKQSSSAFPTKRAAFRTPFARIAATAVLVAGLIIFTPIYAFSQSNSGKSSKAKTEQADSFSNVKVLTDSLEMKRIAQPVNKIMEERGATLRVGSYAFSFRMPKTNASVEVVGKDGEHITTLDGQTEVYPLRNNGFKVITGSYVYIYSGGEWVHVFTKASAPEPPSQ